MLRWVVILTPPVLIGTGAFLAWGLPASLLAVGSLDGGHRIERTLHVGVTAAGSGAGDGLALGKLSVGQIEKGQAGVDAGLPSSPLPHSRPLWSTPICKNECQ